MSKVYSKGIFILFSLFILPLSLLAQTRQITGIVLDENGEGLPGASVAIVAKSTGTTTDYNGKFALEASTDDKLTISFIGYTSQELIVGTQTNFEIKLLPDVTALEEVMVIGYGTQKKKDRTGAVQQVKPSDFNSGVLQDPIQAIQGKMSGVSISKKGGDPNGGFSVLIRGNSGFESGSGPLYVVDGVAGVDPTTISPDDIASFDVLKDASSAAIYGSRASGGVVMITTKKGKQGQSGTVEYNAYYSFDKVANELELASASDIRAFSEKHNLSLSDGGADTDWQSEVYDMGYSQNHSLAYSEGSENGSYRVSANYQDFEGVLKGTGKDRLNLRANLKKVALNDRLTLTTNLASTFEENEYVSTGGNGPTSVIFNTLSRNPTYPVYNPDGSFYEVQDFENSNPVALVNQIDDQRKAKKYMANMKADYEFFDGLHASVSGSYVLDEQEYKYFRPTYQKATSDGGEGKRSYEEKESKIFEALVNYSTQINDKHNIKLLAGYTYQEDFKSNFGAKGHNFISDYVGFDGLDYAQTVISKDIYSDKEGSNLISGIARATYNFDSKYYITGTIRRDGSSKFGENNKWGWFPSGSVAWELSQETFMENVSWLDQLKLRVGYGVTGNQEISNYMSLSRVGAGDVSVDPITGKPIIGVKIVSNDNPDLKWEENHELNIGLDYSFLNDRVYGSIEVYQKNTKDLLGWYGVPTPPNPHSHTLANGGEISNKGIEITLSAKVIDTENLRWTSSFNFTKNVNKVETLSGNGYKLEERYESYVSGRGMVGVPTQIVKPGMALGTFWGWRHAGLDQNGEWLFYTKEGKITKEQNSEDRQEIGNALPDFTINWTNQFNVYKNWDIGFSMRAVVGNDVLNGTKMILGNPNLLPNRNTLSSALDAYGVMKDSPKFSDYYIEDGSFIRLENINIAYNVDVNNIDWMNKCRVYFASNNLFTLTKYSGTDPESNYGGYKSLGIDLYDVYPKTTTFTIGVNVTLN